MVGYVGFLCPIVLPVPRLSCKTLFRVGSRGIQAGGCRTTGPYGSRRGGSKYAPSRTLLFQHVSHLLNTHFFEAVTAHSEKGRAPPRAPGRVVVGRLLLPSFLSSA